MRSSAVTVTALVVLCAAAVAVNAMALSESEQNALLEVLQERWDQATFKEVHPAIAYLALKQLTPNAAAAAKALVPDLRSEAGWADRIVFTEPKQTWSSPLHFINLPADAACKYVRARDCKSNAGEANVCVDGAIQNYTAQLANLKLTPAQRGDALKFVTHFIGDIHQPLHVGNGADWGGNKLTGTFPGQPAPLNLHAIWDAAIPQKRVTDDFGGNAQKWIDGLFKGIKVGDKKKWVACKSKAAFGACSDEWANESAALACTYGYMMADGRTLIPAANFALDDAWYKRTIVVVEKQIVKASVRLAHVLNTILGGGAAKPAAKPAVKPVPSKKAPSALKPATNKATPIRKVGRK